MVEITTQDDIAILELSVRSTNCLRRAEIHTVGELIAFPAEQLWNLRNMGAKSVAEIKAVLQDISSENGNFHLVEQHSLQAVEPATPLLIEESGCIVSDIPIKALRLSVRASNCLKAAGITMASQLVSMTREELMALKNSGSKTVAELLQTIARIKAPEMGRAGHTALGSREDELAQELTHIYGRSLPQWQGEIQRLREKNPEAVGESLLYLLYEESPLRGMLRGTILEMLEARNGEVTRQTLAQSLPAHLGNTTIAEAALLQMENDDLLTAGETVIVRKYPTALAFANGLQDSTQKQVLLGRLAGKTLDECGRSLGITRERVRQHQNKALKNKPRLQEDTYLPFYEKYEISMEDFLYAFEEQPETYHYLEMIRKVKRGDKQALEDILTDEQFPVKLRKQAERALYRDYIILNNIPVRKTRQELVKFHVKTYCRDALKYEEWVQMYNSWLTDIGLGGQENLTVSSHSYANIFPSCDYALWGYWSQLRYYYIPGRDYEELLTALSLEQYENMELSTWKFFRDEPALMARYDIRDEYELHNLLKKILPEDSVVHFHRMPMLSVGNANREEQVLNLLLEMETATVEALANRYEAAYGVKASTMMGSFLRGFDEYFHEGVYSTAANSLAPEQFVRMKQVLCKDYYTLADIKWLYRREFPESDDGNINPYTIKTLGFQVYSTYAIRNTYANASDYFRGLLTKEDIVDTKQLEKSMLSLVSFSSTMYKLRNNYDIIEFMPFQYVNLRRLEAAGVGREQLREFCQEVASSVTRNSFFTVESLRAEGFEHPLFDLGFEDWFYSSVLLEARDFFDFQRLGGTRLMKRGSGNTNLGAMLVQLLEQEEKIDIYDLLERLKEHYGIRLPREKVLEIISGTGLYYDTIMQTVYVDYDTYFEEI